MNAAGKGSLVCAFLAAFAAVCAAQAQPPGFRDQSPWGGPPGQGRPWGGPPGEGRSWGGPPGEGFRPEGDAQSHVARMMFFLREMDHNRNGQLEEDELEDRRGYFARRILERTGVKPEFPLHLSRVEEALQRAYASRAEGAGDGTSAAPSAAQSSSGPESRQPSASGSSSSSTREPLVAGFGTKAQQPSVPGFGPPASGSSSSRGATGRFATAPATEERRSEEQRSENRELEERYRRYAEGLLRQYDRNRNGRLERDEWREMRGDPERADQNHDGVITHEELTARLMEFARRGPSSDDSGDSRGSSSRGFSDRRAGDRDRNRDRDENQRRLRFLTVLERLPEGLPDWFYEKDSDLDGQVSMAEFTTDWTEAKVEEFFQYDLNRDGIITPEECLAALEAEKN